jgi:hypothetical protein
MNLKHEECRRGPQILGRIQGPRLTRVPASGSAPRYGRARQVPYPGFHGFAATQEPVAQNQFPGIGGARRHVFRCSGSSAVSDFPSNMRTLRVRRPTNPLGGGTHPPRSGLSVPRAQPAVIAMARSQAFRTPGESRHIAQDRCRFPRHLFRHGLVLTRLTRLTGLLG